MLDKNGALPATGCASLDPHIIQSSRGMRGISHECPFLYTPEPMDGSRLLGYLYKYQQFWNLVRNKNCQHRVLTNAGRWPRHKSTQDSSISLTKCSFHIFPRLLYTTCLDNLRKDIVEAVAKSLHCLRACGCCNKYSAATSSSKSCSALMAKNFNNNGSCTPAGWNIGKSRCFLGSQDWAPNSSQQIGSKNYLMTSLLVFKSETTQIPPKDIGLFSTTKNGDSISIESESPFFS